MSRRCGSNLSTWTILLCGLGWPLCAGAEGERASADVSEATEDRDQALGPYQGEGTAAAAGFGQSSEPIPEALSLYRQAERAYDEGQYEAAVASLLRAREIDPGAPELLYNIALVYEKLNAFDEALGYLENYLSSGVDAQEQERVQRMMARLRGAREHASPPDNPVQETGEPTERTVAPVEQELAASELPETRVVVRRLGRIDGWFWGTLSTSLVLAAGAAALGTVALMWANRADQFVLGHDGDLKDHRQLTESADRFALATDVLLGAAAGAALTALLLYALRERSGEARVARLRWGGHGGVVWEW